MNANLPYSPKSKLGSWFTWAAARRALIGLAIFATLLAIFYAAENWRGQRAWEKCKREVEARGEVLDWSAYVSAPIPDDENIIKAPKMSEWFVKRGPMTQFTNELSPKLDPGALLESAEINARNPILLARLAVVAPGFKASNNGDAVIQLGATDAPARLRRVVQDAVGESANGPQNFTFAQRSFNQIKPVRILLATDQRLSVADLSRLLPPSLIASNLGSSRLEADADGNSFRLLLAAKPVIVAEEYLTYTDALAPEFNLIREALKRPRIRMEGDFERPFEMPIVNFVFMRQLAQTLASRAQCALLLGQPEQAVRDLSLILELRRFLSAKPTTLVSAMIDVAICGLCVDIIAEGFRLQAWREPELVALQQQLQSINLPPAVTEAFRGERAAVCQTFLVLPARKISDLFRASNESLWDKLTNPRHLLVKFGPRGWIYQNLARIVAVEQTAIEIFNSTTQLIEPRKAEEARRDLASRSPYTALAGNVIPNYVRAAQSFTRNQTRINQALIVCGLERYRLAHGDYPERLDALVPPFVEKLPPDIIGGQPLHYRRSADGKFLLYSVGWNEKDDGGQTSIRPDGSVEPESPDWVWQMPAR